MKTPAEPIPACRKVANGNAFEYEVESFGSSRDSVEAYTVDVSPQGFGCSCPRDDYVFRPRRKIEGINQGTICKHLRVAIVQFYLDNVINKGKK